jgi:apolipoprotein D and lipocalin family protein
MSRERVPRGEILQAAYGVLDKFKLNRTFFVKTQQTECETEAPPPGVVDETSTNLTEELNEGEEIAKNSETEDSIVKSEDDSDPDNDVVKPDLKKVRCRE